VGSPHRYEILKSVVAAALTKIKRVSRCEHGGGQINLYPEVVQIRPIVSELVCLGGRSPTVVKNGTDVALTIPPWGKSWIIA
jgi:hypothetical protein